jgi:hypothetical protein
MDFLSSIGNLQIIIKDEAYKRVNIGVARIAGMAKEIDLKGNHYNVVLLVFFPGYCYVSRIF